jgi:hypothetical protein
LRCSSNASTTWSTISTGLPLRFWDSLILSGLPPRATMKSLMSNIFVCVFVVVPSIWWGGFGDRRKWIRMSQSPRDKADSRRRDKPTILMLSFIYNFHAEHTFSILLTDYPIFKSIITCQPQGVRSKDQPPKDTISQFLLA